MVPSFEWHWRRMRMIRMMIEAEMDETKEQTLELRIEQKLPKKSEFTVFFEDEVSKNSLRHFGRPTRCWWCPAPSSCRPRAQYPRSWLPPRPYSRRHTIVTWKKSKIRTMPADAHIKTTKDWAGSNRRWERSVSRKKKQKRSKKISGRGVARQKNSHSRKKQVKAPAKQCKSREEERMDEREAEEV